MKNRANRMKTKSPSDKKIAIDRMIFGMGIVYLAFLVWAVLYKCGALFIGDGSERTINLLPFNNNTNWEMQFNIAIFIPFGFYLAAAIKKLSFVKQILVALLTSALLEAVQFTLAVGRSDITDLVMNTLGGMIGIAAFYFLARLFGKNERKMTLAICILGTLLVLYAAVSFMLLGQLYIGFMVIRI